MADTTLAGFVTGIGWATKKVVKENILADPSSNPTNFFKFAGAVIAGMGLVDYLKHQKIFPQEY